MRRARAAALAAVTTLALLIGARAWRAAPPPTAHPAPSGPAAPSFWDWGRSAVQRPPPAAAATTLAAERLFVRGSLAGTEPAGDWCVGEGRLRPCAALRERFDHYLLGLGEVSPQDLRALLQRDAAQAHGPVLAAQIVALWDRYGALRQQAPRVPFDAHDRSTWAGLLAEQRGVRRRLLGDDWAAAFYADEERDFEQLQRRLDRGEPAPLDPGAPVLAAEAARRERYGAAAAGRLAAVDAAWADWEQRLAAARGEWSRLQGAPELSALARQEAIGRYLAGHFHGDEMPRIRALLRL